MEAVCAGKTVGRQGGGNAEAVAGVDPARDVWVRAEAGEAALLCGRGPFSPGPPSAGSELRSGAGRAGPRRAQQLLLLAARTALRSPDWQTMMEY